LSALRPHNVVLGTVKQKLAVILHCKNYHLVYRSGLTEAMAGYFNIVFPREKKQFSRITERKCHTMSDAESCFYQPLLLCGWKDVSLKIQGYSK
jgi:hypothetical protein